MEEEFKAEMIEGKRILASSPRENREYRVKKYDFTRPDKFSHDQIKTLSIVHKTFSRLATLSLSGLLRKKAEIKVAQVDQLAFFEFIDSVPDPSAMAVIEMSPLRGSAILQIDPQVCFPLCDWIFGGSGSGDFGNRELSAMERSITSIMVETILSDLGEAWKPLVDLKPSLGQIETSPQMAMIVPPTEMVILVSFKVETGGHEGMINLCIPFLSIEPLLEKLSVLYWHSQTWSDRREYLPAGGVASLKLDCEIVTEGEELSLKQIGQLKKGSLVHLPLFGEGRTHLRFGGESVLDFSRGKSRGGVKYNVTESRLRESGFVPRLVDTSEKKNGFTEDSLKIVAEEVKAIRVSLSERIDQISRNQEQLNDQVFFRSERDIPVESVKKEPFAFIGLPDIPVLHELLAKENRQAIALILSRLDSGLGAELLALFEKELQPELIKRVGLMDRVSPAVVEAVEKVLRSSFNKITESSEPDVKGVEKITQILYLSPRSVEAHVIGSLDQSDSSLSEEIKKRMFVFEDIVVLDRRAVATMAKRVDIQDLCLAMKMVAGHAVRDHILASIPEEDGAKLKKCLEEQGRVLISEVDKAQQRIVAVIKQMEEEGEVLIARSDDLTM